jgi:hypothetical protein
VPLTISYIFVRSDNAFDTHVKTVSVPIGDSAAVSTTWTLGDPVKLSSYNGWEAIKVLSPEQVVSEEAALSETEHDREALTDHLQVR